MRYTLAKLLQSVKDNEEHNMIHLSDGRIFERYTAPVKNNGIYLGRVWTFKDITEQKNREKELKKQKENLERQKKLLEDFADLISHEIRNPLNNAQIRLELVDETKSIEKYKIL